MAKRRWIALGTALALGLAAGEARAVLTLDQAAEISQTTGRLLFAVAGDKH